MNMILRTTVAATAMLSLAACAGMELQNAARVSAAGPDFERGLYAGYLDLAESEFAEGDYRDSDAFAMRATAAGTGGDVEPEAIDARRLPEGTTGDLTDARRQLVEAYGRGARQTIPDQAARAQVMFDCWMQEQEENFQPDDIARCRADFEAAMARIAAATAPAAPVAAAPPKPQPAPAPAVPPKPDVDGMYIVFFELDSAELTAKSREILNQAIADYQIAKPVSIRVTGHADRAGSAAYNDKLSAMRAEMVEQVLVGGLVPKEKLLLQPRGEREPLRLTPDGQPEEKNRRVEIIFE